MEDKFMIIDFIGITFSLIIASATTILIPYCIAQAILAFKTGRRKKREYFVFVLMTLLCTGITILIKIFIQDELSRTSLNYYFILSIAFIFSAMNNFIKVRSALKNKNEDNHTL